MGRVNCVKCPACGGNGSVRHRLQETRVAACSDCLLLFCDRLPGEGAKSAGPNSVQTDEDYTAGLIADDPIRRARYRQLAGARHMEYARRLGRSSFRLLEIGCGSAGLRERFVELGVTYAGIDIDPRVVAAARAGGAGASVQRSDFLEMPESDEEYDVICASQVLEHIRRPVAFVEKVHRLLAPGGVFHCDVPNHNALAGWPSRLIPWTRRRFGGITYPHHSFSYTSSALRNRLEGLFDVEVFEAAPDEDIWGQAAAPSLIQRLYFGMSRALRARSMLVALGAARRSSAPRQSSVMS